MRRLTLWLSLAALGAALAVGAAAAVGEQPHTNFVSAVLSGARVTVHEQTCTGGDGQYRQASTNPAVIQGGHCQLGK